MELTDLHHCLPRVDISDLERGVDVVIASSPDAAHVGRATVVSRYHPMDVVHVRFQEPYCYKGKVVPAGMVAEVHERCVYFLQ